MSRPKQCKSLTLGRKVALIKEVEKASLSKATGSVSDTEDREIVFEEYALYEADVPETGILSDAYIVEMAVNDADNDADEEEPREVPTTTETRNVLRLLRNKVECNGGDQWLMRCVEQLENVFLGPNTNAKQASITKILSL
ncbi:hypothetical protein HPB50_014358 [Hyalomma asiaticum]|uniref:Uncharacterized protein n=1 Tax=Hyalomma asiaticum TaxID=266040 RepID=A0ACB7SVI0_HYAAI|nr:hypothetical protein HPB50_014358 [Hyalomma asiaticum]